MKKILCFFLCCIMFCAALPEASASYNAPNIFYFLKNYEKGMKLFGGSEVNPSPFFCDNMGPFGVYTDSNSEIMIFFDCGENKKFQVTHIGLSSETELLNQITSTVITLKAYNASKEPTDGDVDKLLALSFEIYLLAEGEKYECYEFTVEKTDNVIEFTIPQQ